MARKRSFEDLPKPPIADVLKELAGAEFVPTGYGWVRMSCPFHEDRTPSARVNHELDAFKCFSCGRQGDALKLLQNELRVSFKDALERARALDSGPGTATSKRGKRRPSELLKRGNL